MKITSKEWQEEMKKRFPKGSDTVTFVCPSCKNEASVADFIEEGLPPDLAPQQCLSRTIDSKRCDWAAYGLFRGPVIIIAPDGKELPVFEFAEPDSARRQNVG